MSKRKKHKVSQVIVKQKDLYRALLLTLVRHHMDGDSWVVSAEHFSDACLDIIERPEDFEFQFSQEGERHSAGQTISLSVVEKNRGNSH